MPDLVTDGDNLGDHLATRSFKTIKGTDIASATNITIGTSGNTFDVTGTTTIQHFDNANWVVGSTISLQFDGAVTLTHNAGTLSGNQANILLSGDVNFTTSAGDILTFLLHDSTSWQEISRNTIGSLGGTMTSHIIPDTNDTYDIGSAEYKIRDLYVADNSLWVGDDHKIEIQGGKMKFKKRKKNNVPSAITNASGNASGALTSSGKGSLTLMTLNDWVQYGRSLGGALANARPNDIYGSEVSGDWDSDDATIPQVGTAGKILGYNDSTGVIEEQDKPSASAGILIPHSTTGADYTSADTTSLVYQGAYATETVSAPSSLSAFSNVANAYDGNLSTYAETTSSPWLGTGADAFTIDYGKVLYGVGIQSKVSNKHNGYNTGISISYSTDGSAWTNIYSQTDSNINTWIDTGTFNLTNVNVRYLRVNRLGGNGWNKVRIYELKVTNMSAPDVESITSDFGADKLVCGINANVGEIDDSTITISTSDDNSTYTLNRTVLTSKMSQNGNNFIRMNPTSCRYVKIIGVTPDNISRATASFAQLPDADGYIKPDSYVLANHEHATISTTDTSLGLDGL